MVTATGQAVLPYLVNLDRPGVNYALLLAWHGEVERVRGRTHWQEEGLSR